MTTCGKPLTWWESNGTEQEHPCVRPPGHDGACVPLSCAACAAERADALAVRLDALEAQVRPFFEDVGIPVREHPARTWVRERLRRAAARLDALAGAL